MREAGYCGRVEGSLVPGLRSQGVGEGGQVEGWGEGGWRNGMRRKEGGW